MLFNSLPTDIKWFDRNADEDDVFMVLNFIRRLPQNLENIFQDVSFISSLNKIGRYNDVNDSLFFAAFQESKQLLIKNLDDLERNIRENEYSRNDFRESLRLIGFTENSLQLKAATLDILWNRTIEIKKRRKRSSIYEWFISSVKNPITKAIRRLLQFLNDLMDSLKIVIPGLESLKEWKDVGESYISLADKG
jgi:hypothetical protein